MSRPRVLVTGGTGFLGKKVIPLLREKFEVDVLSRSGKTEVQGDLTQWNGGMHSLSQQRGKYSLLLHMAGLYDLMAGKADCYQHNVSATGIALKMADAMQIPFFINTSSVAAAINSSLGLVKPFDLNFSKSFPDPYSESKAMAETVLQNWPSSTLEARINLRLGVLVGSVEDGEIERIDGPYYAAEAFKKIRNVLESFPTSLPLPGSEKTRLPLVPVDACAKAVVQFCEWTLMQKPQGYQSFHVTPESGLKVKDFYASALNHLGIPNKGITLIDKIPDSFILKASKMLAKFPEEQLYYLLHFPIYDSSATTEILGDHWCPDFKNYEQIFWSGYEKFVSHR